MINPLKRSNKSRKGGFCINGICKCTVAFKLKIYLFMFIRPSDIKYPFVCSNFVSYRIIRIAEMYSEPSRKSMMELFTKKVTGFQPLTFSLPIPDEERSLTSIFIFTPLCGASKVFMKALKALINFFEVPQRSVKIKIEASFNTTFLNTRGGKG